MLQMEKLHYIQDGRQEVMSKKIIGFLDLYNSPNLGPLTETRTLGSTSFLGRFALMDFSLSNFTNSGIDEINILVKDNFRSVAKHVGSLKTWVSNTKIARQNILITEKGIRNPKDNTELECLLQNDWVLLEEKADIIVLQPAHILTTIDLREVIEEHSENDADVTVVYQHIKNADETFSTSNIVKMDGNRVVSFKKNTGKIKESNVSLEIYVIGNNTLKNILHNEEYMKLGSMKKVIERLVANKAANVCGHEYVGYARCIASFQHFVDYSFELLDYNIAKDLYGKDWPIYTLTHNTQPTMYGESAKVKNSFVANGAEVNGGVENSIISRYVTIGKGAIVKNSIILTGTYIDDGAVISNAVIDKYCHVACKTHIEGKKTSPVYIEQGKFVK